jgi:uracil-DNA glycosylase
MGEIYPPKELVFRVFEMDVKYIRILLLGQDPYHGPNQAHGLSFSVPDSEKIPPSLKNIYKELKLEFPERNYTFNTGNLEQWFQRENIFLLHLWTFKMPIYFVFLYQFVPLLPL